MKNKLSEAIELRKNNNPKKALVLMQALHKANPNDAEVNYQIAWTYDVMSKEREAVPFYETALAHGLFEGRVDAMLGLGSTFRNLGEYKKSLDIFDNAIGEFPDNRALRVFRALTLYNLKKHSESVSELLVQLLETTNDASIKSYERSLSTYKDRLDDVWK
jgi:tetratricopeptide (TPR) repeat protein